MVKKFRPHVLFIACFCPVTVARPVDDGSFILIATARAADRVDVTHVPVESIHRRCARRIHHCILIFGHFPTWMTCIVAICDGIPARHIMHSRGIATRLGLASSSFLSFPTAPITFASTKSGIRGCTATHIASVEHAPIAIAGTSSDAGAPAHPTLVVNLSAIWDAVAPTTTQSVAATYAAGVQDLSTVENAVAANAVVDMRFRVERVEVCARPKCLMTTPRAVVTAREYAVFGPTHNIRGHAVL